MDKRSPHRQFQKSSALFDASGDLIEWDAGFELEFEAASGLMRRGVSYEEILRFLYANHELARAKVEIPGDAAATRRRTEHRIRTIGKETEFDYVNLQGDTVLVRQALTPSGGFLRTARNVTLERSGEKAVAAALQGQRIAVSEVPIWLRRDPSGTLTYPPATPELKRLMGLPPDSDTSDPMSLYSLIEQTPEELAQSADAMLRSVQTMGAFSTEFRLRDSDRGLRWIQTTMAPAAQPDGAILWTGIIKDITHEKAAQDQIELLRSVFMQSSDGILIVETEPKEQQATIIYANLAFEELSGFLFSELAGRSTATLTVFEAPQAIYDEIGAILTRGEAGCVEYVAYRRDGSLIYLENRFAVIQTKDDGARRVVFMLRDIRDRIERDAELRAAEARYRALYDNAPESIVLVRCELDGTFVVEAANPAFIKTIEKFGAYGDPAIVGKRVEEVAAAWSRDWVLTDYRACVSEPQIMRTEYESPDGVVFVSTLVPIIDANGRVAHLSATTRDVTDDRRRETDLRQAKEAAETASQAKGEFLANMSHELRTPLNAIIGFSEIIEHRVARNGWTSNYGEYLRDIKDSGRHLLDLINTILDLSKIEAGMMSLDLGIVDFNQLLIGSVAILSQLAREREVDLQLSQPREWVKIDGDFVKLRQVVLNVLSNAIQFTPPGGVVAVSAEATESGTTIVVADTGCGISEIDLQRIGRPFVQVQNSLSRTHAGTGLGLSIAKQLCELHGGRLTIESQVSKGTVVRIELPPPIHRTDAVFAEQQ